MENKLYNEIAEYFAMALTQLTNQDPELLKDLLREWEADELIKVHNLGYRIIRR